MDEPSAESEWRKEDSSSETNGRLRYFTHTQLNESEDDDGLKIATAIGWSKLLASRNRSQPASRYLGTDWTGPTAIPRHSSLLVRTLVSEAGIKTKKRAKNVKLKYNVRTLVA